mmetsp:Transcript_95734/g.166297  ORF Transcript_95734/g.166297 Transcript_95734/m.166297 type:complete len:430 (-) Transcript_95734:132-1421(-)
MHKLVLLPVCLTLVSSGCRKQIPSERWERVWVSGRRKPNLQSSLTSEQWSSKVSTNSTVASLNSLAMFLLAFSPKAAFHIDSAGAHPPMSTVRLPKALSAAVDVSMTSTIDDEAVTLTDPQTSEATQLNHDIVIEKPLPKCGPKVNWPVSKHKIKAYEEAAALRDTRPCILLCRPWEDGNLGAAARAMLNFGLTELRLVNPDADPKSEEAIMRASGARQILHDAAIFDATASAVADLHLVFATTARQRENVPLCSLRESMQLALSAIQRGERVGFLFGCERNGLDGEEVSHAHTLVKIPTLPGFSSLNLAQAVLLIAYEWGSASAEIATDTIANLSGDNAKEANGRTNLGYAEEERAPSGQLESLFTFLNTTLREAGFHPNDEGRFGATFGKLRRLIMRGEPSKTDLSIFWGAIRRIRDYSAPGNDTNV